MGRADRAALLQELHRRAELYRGPRLEKFRRLSGRLLLTKLVGAAGITRRVTAKTFFGLNMHVHLPELVGAEIYKYGFFEEGLTRAIIETLPEAGVFVDVGAHIGYYSMLAAQLVGRRGRVVAFEPTPRTFAELGSNTIMFDNIDLVPKAAWDGPARLTLRDFGWRRSAFNSVAGARLAEGARSASIDVEAIALDDWLEAHRTDPSFIKIDAESAEYRVLRGLRRTIERHHPLLSLEVGDYNLPGVPSSAELIHFIAKLGYEPWQYERGKFVRHQVADSYGFDNLVFVPTAGSPGGSVPQATAWPSVMA